jgi:hypothetical protein
MRSPEREIAGRDVGLAENELLFLLNVALLVGAHRLWHDLARFLAGTRIKRSRSAIATPMLSHTWGQGQPAIASTMSFRRAPSEKAASNI